MNKMEELTNEENKLIEELMKQEKYKKLMEHLMKIEVGYHITFGALNNIARNIELANTMQGILEKGDE